MASQGSSQDMNRCLENLDMPNQRFFILLKKAG